MARSLILSNNKMLIALDERGQIEDLFFPYVGLENHVSRESVHRIGVYVEGKMSWLSDRHWKVTVSCERASFVGRVYALSEALGIKLEFTDVVYNEKNIVIRNVTVTNLAGVERDVKIFFAQEFEISESMVADTAYYDPRSRTIVHYKGRRAISLNAFAPSGQFHEYTIGEFRKHGKAGSYRDAEDGSLALNPIEHGRVDSVIALPLNLEAGAEESVYFWICCGESISEVNDLNRYVISKNPAHLINTTRDYWYAWVHKYSFIFHGLSDKVANLFYKSLFVVHGAADQGGAILASADTSMLQGGKDTYTYMWPRDGSFIAMALTRIGDYYTAKRFFEFCNAAMSEDGYLMHKFCSDGALGSSWQPWMQNGKPRLPIQEDETALPIIALKRYYEATHDIEFIEQLYNSFVERAANFLVEYRYENGLPYPSFDLWEEKYKVHTYTAATVYGALTAASEFAGILGKQDHVDHWSAAAREVREAILEHLFDPKEGKFFKSILFTEKGDVERDEVIDISSVYGVACFNVLTVDDPRFKQAKQAAIDRLSVRTDIGGISRYEDDAYYRIDADTPGNPWILTTLWRAQIDMLNATREEDLAPIVETLEWCVERVFGANMLPEQVHPHTGAPLSATPLTWSHAEFIVTLTQYLDKLDAFGVCEGCNPVSHKKI